MIISLDVAQRIRVELTRLKRLRDGVLDAARAGDPSRTLTRAEELGCALDNTLGLVDAVLEAVEEDQPSGLEPQPALPRAPRARPTALRSKRGS
ncbi:MAG: hypothetical protein H6718_01740 [Polyangiaceae bacterium]|nr:hypothetical protein [Myxococcales bacterium]MCB9584086.1 hypothetical protein [Polyangiaceae bacterium]